MHRLTVQVRAPFPVPAEQAYRYLREPQNRPAWQSSLRRVEGVDGRGEAGTTWIDVTWPGLRPRLIVTADEPGRRWAEHGVWHGVQADLGLDFIPSTTGCQVRADVQVHGPFVGVLRPLLIPVFASAIRADLRRAAKLLSH